MKYYAYSLKGKAAGRALIMKKLKKKKTQDTALQDNKTVCRHDYKNAIQVGNVDYVCPLCKELLDPFEWFFMNSFEFVEVSGRTGK